MPIWKNFKYVMIDGLSAKLMLNLPNHWRSLTITMKLWTIWILRLHLLSDWFPTGRNDKKKMLKIVLILEIKRKNWTSKRERGEDQSSSKVFLQSFWYFGLSNPIYSRIIFSFCSFVSVHDNSANNIVVIRAFFEYSLGLLDCPCILSWSKQSNTHVSTLMEKKIRPTKA